MVNRTPSLKFYIMLSIIMISGCSAAGNEYTFIPNDAKDLITSPSKVYYNSTAYGFKCGDSTFWLCPKTNTDISWIGPVLFPYVFPSSLFGDEPDKRFDYLAIRFYTDKDDFSVLEKFTPLLKLPNGNTIRPSACKEEKITEGLDCVHCEYDILAREHPSFTLLLESNMYQCIPKSIEFKRQTMPFYTPFVTR
jgi:hypothetical protein